MPISKQPKKSILIRLTPEQHADLSQRAHALGMSIANMVRRGLHLPDERQGQRADLPPDTPK